MCIRDRAELCRVRIIPRGIVTIGMSYASASRDVLHPDHPMLSRKTSHNPVAAVNLSWARGGRNRQQSFDIVPTFANAVFKRRLNTSVISVLRLADEYKLTVTDYYLRKHVVILWQEFI